MEKKRFTPNLFFVLAIVLVVVLTFYARRKGTDSMTFKIESDLPQVTTKAMDFNDKRTVSSEEAPTGEVAPEDKELHQWVKEEARLLNSTNVNQKAIDEDLHQKVKAFGLRQLVTLKEIAQNGQKPMNERVLSTYMIGLSTLGDQNLVDLASSELEQKDFAPHTEGEIRATGNRSLRIMAIDSIFARKHNMETRLSELEAIVQKSNDQIVRDYAQKKADLLRQ